MSTISSIVTSTSDEEIEEMSREDVLLAAAIIFFVAFFGLIFNLLGITVVLKNPILKNSFGSLCLSHSIANSGVLFVFFIWSAPATYIQAVHTQGMINKLLGQLNILCWDACVYSHLAISFNRFFSIAIPARASLIFSRRNTLVIIGIVWSIAFCHIFPYFWYEQCYITYDPITWTWNFASTRCGFVISTYTDYYTSVAIFIAMSSVDFSTLILLVLHRKHSSFASNEEAVRRRNVEIRFFMQSCLQGALFFYEIFNFYYVSTLNTNQWYVFFTATFAWEVCHCLDGFVVVLFHFRRRIFLGDVRSVGFFGIILNLLCLLTIFKSANFKNAFGTLSFNHSCLNLFILLIYFLWVTPITYVQSSDSNSLLGKIIGQLYVFLWFCMVYSHLALSINRCVSLIFPNQAKHIFTYHSCLAFVFFIWLIGFCHVIPLFWYDQCFLTYDPFEWIWSFGTTKCALSYKMYVIHYLGSIVTTLALIINLITFAYIRMKKQFSWKIPEIKFFMETFVKCTLFLLISMCSIIFGSYFYERWKKYMSTCFAWQVYHLLDILILLILHFDRNLLAEHRKRHPVSFINVDNHLHTGHHPHSHDLIHPNVHSHNLFSKVDTV